MKLIFLYLFVSFLVFGSDNIDTNTNNGDETL